MGKKIFLLFAFFSILGMGRAQEVELGVFGGVSYYLGDINPGKHFSQVKPAYGLSARHNFNKRVAVRLSAFRGQLFASDQVIQFETDRMLKFRSNITDISVQMEFNFLPYFTGSLKEYLTPYIFGGFSAFFFNPKSDGVELREIGTEGQLVGFLGRDKYPNYSFGVPFGLGVKYSLTDRIGLTVEWGARKIFTDYLDDVSTTYYLDGPNINPNDIEQLLSDPTRSKLPEMQRGDPGNNDWYFFSGITISYMFDLSGGPKCLNEQM